MAGINYAMSASDGLQSRKRNVAMAGIDSSPGSIEDMDDTDARDEKKRQPVKRACNECRQQKVRAVRRYATVAVVTHTLYSSDAMSFKNRGPIVLGVVD